MTTGASPVHGTLATDTEAPRLVVPALQTSWLRPDTVLRPPGGLPLLVTTSPSEGLTTVRVFVPFDESFAEAGTGRVLAQAAAERVRGTAARVGAQFSALRVPAGIAYSVTGSDEDFDYLASILRSAMAEPTAQDVVVRRLAARARTTIEREQETGRGWVSSDLAARLCPTAPPEAGMSGSLSSISARRLIRFWARTHVRNRASVVVVTRAPLPLVLSSLRTLGLAEGGVQSPASEVAPSSGSAPSLQVLRRWYGEARPLPEEAAAETEVLARLLDDAVTVSGQDYDLFIELRRVRCSSALLAVGTAYRAGDGAMRTRVSGLLGELTESLSEARVREAASDVRATLLAEVSTPAGMAGALGREGGDTGSPDGLAGLYERLGSIGLADMSAFLDALAGLTPLRSELRP